MKDYDVLYAETAYDDSMKLEVYFKEAVGFGPHAIKILMVEPDGDRYLLIEDKIYNDGSNLLDKNIGIKWLKDARAEVALRGKEMKTKTYLVQKKASKFKAELM